MPENEKPPVPRGDHYCCDECVKLSPEGKRDDAREQMNNCGRANRDEFAHIRVSEYFTFTK